jgi:YHS domain.
MKHAFIFLATFALGAVIALSVRAARHNTSDHPAPAQTAHTAHAHEHTAAESKTPNPEPQTAPAATATPVNTVCAICGMDVDPDLPTAEYQGQTIGFGCKACPPKFKANPDKYGPAALRNEVVE